MPLWSVVVVVGFVCFELCVVVQGWFFFNAQIGRFKKIIIIRNKIDASMLHGFN